MVVRYVFAKFNAAHSSAGADGASAGADGASAGADGASAGADVRRKAAEHTMKALAGIEGVRKVRVGIPADDKAAAAWDLSIEIEFDRIADVEPYLADPVHRTYVDDYLRPRLEVIKAWNLEIIEVGPE